jgi:hypothetical protein
MEPFCAYWSIIQFSGSGRPIGNKQRIFWRLPLLVGDEKGMIFWKQLLLLL